MKSKARSGAKFEAELIKAKKPRTRLLVMRVPGGVMAVKLIPKEK
ncbi:hypothetical protein LCGC14_0721510 [marine sediment metagenome]|uniref:Uncharacterized protein n=1 Tax=marine sediment metagenome TaxID=412755 RepID=A0A0F9TJJ8_9ZZZZ